MTDWRLLVDGAAGGAANMALDQTLFEGVQAGGQPVLRLYRWDPPCLSLGRNEPMLYDTARVFAAGATVVRRPTGGLAVYHDQELTYAVVAPITVVGRPRHAFGQISRALVNALRSLGVPALQATVTSGASGRIGVGQGGTCFAAPAPGEIVVDGRKVAGSAQRCEAAAILQHGSLLLDGDQSIVSLFHAAGVATTPAFTTVRATLGHVPDWESLCNSIAHSFCDEFGARLEPGAWHDAERTRAARLVKHFEDEAWTWRR